MKEVMILDSCFTDPQAIRKHALASEYIDWKGYDGEIYKRVSITEVPGLQDKIEELVGPVEMLGMGYRLNYDSEQPNQSIHTDLGWGTHAIVLYLTNGDSGTAFWTHKKTKTDWILPGQLRLFEKLQDDWNNREAWQLREFVEMKFNRMIMYESCLYHSRYPLDAFGSTPETGRLIAVAFFTPKGNKS